MSSTATSSAIIACLACALGAQDAPPPKPNEPFPGVRVDLAARTVEFDGFVPIDAHSEATPHVYLELFVCSPDTREHESLVVTKARPSHIHAALLMIGLQPGRAGSWTVDDGEMAFVAPTGSPVVAEFVWTDPDGKEHIDPAPSWVRHVETGEPFPLDAFVFAGSRFVQKRGAEVYDADGAGTIIGLTTFGSEVIAWPTVISPESSVQTPVWIADAADTPRVGTEVTVRLRPAKGD